MNRRAKERILDRALSVFEGKGRSFADGIAFHWYSGDHFDALRRVRELLPEKKLLLSENCIEYSKYSVGDPTLARTLIAHEIIGDMESGTNAFLDWNLVLDERGGPNYAGNFCHAPLLFDTRTGTLNKQSVYDALWHFAHFITPGSKRILTSSFASDIEKTAFRREDGKTALVLQNCGKRRKVSFWFAGELADLTLPPRSLTTILIEEA